MKKHWLDTILDYEIAIRKKRIKKMTTPRTRVPSVMPWSPRWCVAWKPSGAIHRWCVNRAEAMRIVNGNRECYRLVRFDLHLPPHPRSVEKMKIVKQRAILEEAVIHGCRLMRRDCCDPKEFTRSRNFMWARLMDLDNFNDKRKRLELARRRVKGAR